MLKYLYVYLRIFIFYMVKTIECVFIWTIIPAYKPTTILTVEKIVLKEHEPGKIQSI